MGLTGFIGVGFKGVGILDYLNTDKLDTPNKQDSHLQTLGASVPLPRPHFDILRAGIKQLDDVNDMESLSECMSDVESGLALLEDLLKTSADTEQKQAGVDALIIFLARYLMRGAQVKQLP